MSNFVDCDREQAPLLPPDPRDCDNASPMTSCHLSTGSWLVIRMGAFWYRSSTISKCLARKELSDFSQL